MKMTHQTITIKGMDLFYREAGNTNKDTILCLHGFPSSSHMYRDIIELLSNDFHLVAPDYPGFGLSDAPSLGSFDYTFDNIAQIIEDFSEALNLSSFYLLMQDYGGPIGFRIATMYPNRIKGLIIQNANAYMEGLGEWAIKIGDYQKANDMEGLTNFKNFLMSPEGIKEQYFPENGETNKVSAISYLTDIAFINREGINKKQTALFTNYGTNFAKYPEWQTYFKTHQPPTLIVWGIHDKFFSKNGADAYKQHLTNATIQYYDGGHFMIEQYAQEVAIAITDFIKQ